MQKTDKVVYAVVCGVTVKVQGVGLPLSEVKAYVKHCTEKYKDKRIDKIDIKVDGEDVDLYIEFKAVGFERIRRITGYLVGSLDRFNNAKQAEVRDRLKHNI